ncbi:MAG TPA: galactokinase, partial [Clostridia bacterium]|nr:galactokinase [Clostridia bacterium]
DAYVISDVPKGSGLSSSASFEVLIACIFNELFNAGRVKPETMALAGQYAENVFFGKPCGLMDQMASAYGGIISIDFKDSGNLVIKRVDIDFAQSGYIPVYVKTGDSHADLTHEYAAITDEMGMIANYFGSKKLRFVAESDFYAAMPELIEKMPGRAILRAMHYFNENKRVSSAVEYLAVNNINGFLACVNESGTSSWELLQNCYSGSEQRTTVALALAKKLLGNDGAVRVHGGGFGGGILLFVPTQELDKVKTEMDHVLGAGSSSTLYLRRAGACKLI